MFQICLAIFRIFAGVLLQLEAELEASESKHKADLATLEGEYNRKLSEKEDASQSLPGMMVRGGGQHVLLLRDRCMLREPTVE